MRGRIARFLLIVVIGGAVGIAIGGVPKRSADAPVRVVTETTGPTPSTTISLSPPPLEPPPAAPAQTRPPAEVRVMAHNASNVPGTATRVTNRLKEGGYNALGPGQDVKSGRPSTTMLFYTPGFEREAAALAEFLKVSPEAAKPLPDPPPAPLTKSVDVVVVVADDVAKRQTL